MGTNACCLGPGFAASSVSSDEVCVACKQRTDSQFSFNCLFTATEVCFSLLGLEVDSWLQGDDLICHQWPVSLGTWIGLEMLTERTLVI